MLKYFWYYLLIFTQILENGHADIIDAKCVCQTCDQTEPKPSCMADGDILIMIDASVCHAGHRWELIRHWSFGLAAQFKHVFNIGDRIDQSGSSRVAAYSFSDHVRKLIDFDDGHFSMNDLQRIRSNATNQLLGGKTNFDEMVEEVINIFEDREDNRMKDQNEKWMILLTNGIGTKGQTDQGRIEYNAEEISDLSDQLRDAEIRVIPVHVTEKCSSSEMEDLSFLCPEMELLEKWFYPYEDMDRPQVPFSMQNPQSQREIAEYISEQLAAYGGSPLGPKSDEQLRAADITFLIDGSDSIKKHEWADTKEALINWMSGYWEQSPYTQISVRQFSDISIQEFGPASMAEDCDDTNDLGDWKEIIRNIDQRASSTNLHEALQEVVDDDYTNLRNYREDRDSILFLLTDGWTSEDRFNDIRAGSKKFGDLYNIFIVVGVGEEVHSKNIQKLVNQLGVTNGQSHLDILPDFSSLSDTFPSIRTAISVIQYNMRFSRVKRAVPIIQAENKEFTRKKRQLRGPRPDVDNTECTCEVPITTLFDDDYDDYSDSGSSGSDKDYGQPGKQGEPGKNGQPGERGETGEKGERGEDGDDGDDGNDGRDGIEGQIGQQGEDGEEGRPGQNGYGPKGETGEKGDAGRQGRPGEDGRDGSRGPKGEEGDDGYEGADGINGTDGKDGPKGSKGQPGRSMPGDDGECEAPGPRGLDGLAGYPGNDGKDGEDGRKGPQGVIGEPGKFGRRGRRGQKGPVGEVGEPGLNGNHGVPGDHGEIGEPGFPGAEGEPGEKGRKGEDGRPGLPGQNGLPGRKGARGPVGNPGEHGQPGEPGERGVTGEDGPPGDDGRDGIPGLPGIIGEIGRRGLRGFPGPDGEVDLESLYKEIKEMLRPLVNCKKCEKKKDDDDDNDDDSGNDNDDYDAYDDDDDDDEPLLRAVFLVDGSDSIRGSIGSRQYPNEWELATSAVQEITRRLDVDELTVVQFSDGPPLDLMVAEEVTDRNKDDLIDDIEETLGSSQMSRGTDTYHALDHVANLIKTNEESTINALFVITDGEPRDDENDSFVERVLENVEDVFDYVFPIAVGQDFQDGSEYADRARDTLRNIQGRLSIEPIFLQDYEEVADRVVSHFEKIDRDNPIRRRKRAFRVKQLRKKRQLKRRPKNHPLKKWHAKRHVKN